MAKHAKPTLTSTLSRHSARGAAALTMASFGFLATAPAAFAGGGDGDYDRDHGHKKHGDVHHKEWKDVDSHESQGIVNVADNDVLVPIQVCNNYVPVNVLGVQVPIEDVAGNIPILSQGDNEADSGDETCQQAAAIGDADKAHRSGATSPALVPGSNDVATGADAGDQAVDGASGLGSVQGLVGDNGLHNPADALAPTGVERSVGDELGRVPQQLTDQAPVPAPTGDLGMLGTPDVAQAEGLVPSGL